MKQKTVSIEHLYFSIFLIWKTELEFALNCERDRVSQKELRNSRYARMYASCQYEKRNNQKTRTTNYFMRSTDGTRGANIISNGSQIITSNTNGNVSRPRRNDSSRGLFFSKSVKGARGLVAPSKSDLIDFCRFWWLFRWICGNYLSSIFEKNILEFGGRLIYPFSSPKFRKTESWMRLWHPTIVEYDYFGNGDNYKFLPRRSIDSKLVIND